MSFFLARYMHDYPITADSIAPFDMGTISNYFEISTIIAKRYHPNLMEQELRPKIAENMNHLRACGLEYAAKTKVDFLEDRDEDAIERMV